MELLRIMVAFCTQDPLKRRSDPGHPGRHGPGRQPPKDPLLRQRLSPLLPHSLPKPLQKFYPRQGV